MSELISGKEALRALADGGNVESKKIGLVERDDISWLDTPKTRQLTVLDFISGQWHFRLKPRTITINGVELNQCYSVAIDYAKNEVKIEFKNRNDAEALHDVISKLYGFK